MSRKKIARVTVGVSTALAIALGFHVVIQGESGDQTKHFIVHCPGACLAVAASIRDLGGDVTHEYENVEAIAVEVPAARLADVPTIAGARAVWKDVLIAAPAPVGAAAGSPARGAAVANLAADDAQAIDAGALPDLIGTLPADYSFNNSLINASSVQAAGNLGQGVITAVIDSGTANAPAVVPSLAGTVIGGENFATTDPVQSATSRRNGPHGTWVGTVIAGHANFLFANTRALVRSLRIHAPSSVIACTNALGCPSTSSIVPMIGVAPASKIYALKVFASNSGSAPNSRVVAAMDRAITLRRNFNNGMPSVPVAGDGSEDNPFVFDSLKIDVVNMSLGGPTLFAGRELEELLTIKMLEVGIAPAISAGNEGFGAMTAASPGDGIGALGTAAANSATHARVLGDLAFGVGFGVLFRPTTHTQTADFSSRGPTADGRFKPDVIANGFATFAQGTCQGNDACLAGTSLAGLSLVSGTSFSAPTAAGALALLRKGVASASAVNLRNAIIDGANPSVLGDGSGPIDQGRGFVDVAAALARLESGHRSSRLIGSDPDDRVRENIAEIGFRTVRFENGQFSTHVSNLVPGQVAQFFVQTAIDDKLTITLRNITPENPPETQNQLFGDDVVVNVLDAPTSTNNLLFQGFVVGDTIITATASPGLVRVALEGDWTNAGRISADLLITREHVNIGRNTAEGSIAQGQVVAVPIVVPPGASQLDFELSWKGNWSRYPTNDIALILQDPGGKLSFDGATNNSPERVSINKPAAGTWVAAIEGFTIHAELDDDDHDEVRVPRDAFELRVTIDGVRVVLPGAQPSHDREHDREHDRR
jgi:hypothetical protein